MGLLGASRLPRSLSEPARLQIPFDPEFPVHLRLLRLRSSFAFLDVCRYVGKPRAAPCSILPASSGPRRPKTSSSFTIRFTSRIPRLLPPTRRARTPPHHSGRARPPGLCSLGSRPSFPAYNDLARCVSCTGIRAATLLSASILIVLLHTGLPWMVLRARWEGIHQKVDIIAGRV